jgi:hypothetical protein
MKKIFIISAVLMFMLTTVNVNAIGKDCSNYKTFSHKWNMCKVGKLPSINNSSSETETETETKSKKISGGIKGFFNKIRTFGGDSVGSAD